MGRGLGLSARRFPTERRLHESLVPPSTSTATATAAAATHRPQPRRSLPLRLHQTTAATVQPRKGEGAGVRGGRKYRENGFCCQEVSRDLSEVLGVAPSESRPHPSAGRAPAPCPYLEPRVRCVSRLTPASRAGSTNVTKNPLVCYSGASL